MDANIPLSILPVASASNQLNLHPPRIYPHRFIARALACTGVFFALAAPALAQTGSSPSSTSSGDSVWALIHDTSDLQILERFILAFPDSPFVSQAMARKAQRSARH